MGIITYLVALAALFLLQALSQTNTTSGEGFVSFCAYPGANLTDGRWLGLYCLNNDIEIWGYNYTWYDPRLASWRLREPQKLCTRFCQTDEMEMQARSRYVHW